jgi:RNA recognition motif-containing protein
MVKRIHFFQKLSQFSIFYSTIVFSLNKQAWINMKTIYVGNLPFTFGDSDLANLFQGFGEVKSAKIIMDRDTGRSKGFGFVDMDDDGAAMNAIEQTNGQEINGRAIRVNESQPREARPPRFGGGGGNRSFGGGDNRRPRRSY